RHRKPQGRVRRLSRVRRLEQTLSLQDPADGVFASSGDGHDVQGAHAGRRDRDPGRDRRGVRRVRQVSGASRSLAGTGRAGRVVEWLSAGVRRMKTEMFDHMRRWGMLTGLALALYFFARLVYGMDTSPM